MSASDALVAMADNNPAVHNAEVGQVKFTKDSESIDVTAEMKLIGLTKEQLERYRNDPLWKPIRYTMFVLFWVIWIGMFVGAILIVLMSPKCAAKKDKQYHENMVAYQIYTPTFRDTDGDGVGDFSGIKEKLGELRRIGVTAVWPTPLLTTNKDEFTVAGIKDSQRIDTRFGEESDLKALIKRTHDLNLYFIADLPLTISSDNPEAARQGIGGGGKIRLLNLAVPSALAAVKKTATKLIELGVDGLSFAQYGFKYPAGSVDANKLDQLASEIRRENSERFYQGNDQFIFISDSSIDKQNHSINFYTRSLGRFLTTPDICPGSVGFIDCLKDSSRAGIQQLKKNASSLPLWQFGDISHPRTDSLLTNLGDQATFLATSIQLFLPGAVKIYYGEELGLPSIKEKEDSQFGLMQWEATNKGFTSFDGKLFFKSLTGKQAAELNFKDQSDATHSNLKVFKKLAQLRTKDEVFTDGDYNSAKLDGLDIFVRFLAGDDKVFILVANWPTDTNKNAKQFTIRDIVKLLNLKASAVELLIDHPPNVLNSWHLDTESKLTLESSEFVLLRVEILN